MARTTDRKPISASKRRAFRLVIVVVSPLLFLALVEIFVTAVFGEQYYPLPGVEEAAHYLHFALPERFNPLFELREDEAGDHLHTVPELYEDEGFFVRKQRFAAQRNPAGVRVAFLGGSSVQGWPYREDGVVFPELVGQLVQEKFPDRRVDVINAGVGSYSSFQLVDSAWQVQAFDPDVVVIYAGHNDQGYYFFNREFLDNAALNTTGGGRRLFRFLNRFNFYQGGRKLRDRWLAADESPTPSEDDDGPTAIIPATAFIPQDERIAEIGVELYIDRVRIQQGYLPIIFERNLEAIVQGLMSEGTTVILATPTSNLRDFPPAFSMHWEPLGASAEAKFDDLLRRAAASMQAGGVGLRRMPGIEGTGENLRASDPWGPIPASDAREVGSHDAIAACAEPLRMLGEANKISDTFALVWFLRGTCLLHLDPAAAREAFARARELSPAMAPKQRAPSTLVDVVRRVGEKHGLTVIDMEAAFSAASEHGITDGTLFVDNLHFSAAGHRVAAETISEALAAVPAVRDGPSPDRPPDPSSAELARLLEDRAKHPKWGMDIFVPGASMQYDE